MLAIFLMAVTAALVGSLVRYLAGEVAVRMGYSRKEGRRYAATAGFSAIASPKHR
jgi:membrane protein YqaA with SNARE-associated domain